MIRVQKPEARKRQKRLKIHKIGKEREIRWWGWLLVGLGAAASSFLTIWGLVTIINYVPPDLDPPEITLNGEAEVELTLGSDTPYLDAGAIATDERDGGIEVMTEIPEIDIWNASEYEIKYIATDAAGNRAEASRKVTVVPPDPVDGAIYLTFDDGPSEHTARLLDVLKRYNVKATFFVIGRDLDEMIKREYDEGHAIGLHTWSHNYAHIYQNQTTFFDDLYAIQNKVKEITGYTSNLMRFPGGSSNTVSRLYDHGSHIMSSLIYAVEERGFRYFDWNISSGDAGGARTANAVYENVVSRFAPGEWIVLQHDTQGYSVDAVERIIQFGKKNGYQFRRLEFDSYGAWHRVTN